MTIDFRSIVLMNHSSLDTVKHRATLETRDQPRDAHGSGKFSLVLL